MKTKEELLKELEDFANDIVHRDCCYSDYLEIMSLIHELQDKI